MVGLSAVVLRSLVGVCSVGFVFFVFCLDYIVACAVCFVIWLIYFGSVFGVFDFGYRFAVMLLLLITCGVIVLLVLRILICFVLFCCNVDVYY